MAMATDRDAALPAWLPALLQMASPALPIGSFSYSQGLEAAAWSGLVRDEASALAWIESHWQQAFAVRELPAVLAAADALADAAADAADEARAGAAHRADEIPAPLLAALLAIDEEFLASRDSAEARAEARQTGAALLRWLGTLHAGSLEHRLAQAILARHDSLCAPIAFALCGWVQGLPPAAIRFAWAFAWIENQVQAAVKIVPLGQSAGQRLLMALRARVTDPAPLEPWSFAPLASVMAMRHERQYTRLFRS